MVRHRPKAHYMRKQPDITEGMRAILVDWLVEVGEEYKLRTETLYLAVNFLDRKYEEIYPPDVDEFVYITDDTYTKRQLLRMEHLLLKVLAFDLTVPTTNQFLLQYLRRQGVCIRTENLAKVCQDLQDQPLPNHPPPLPLSEMEAIVSKNMAPVHKMLLWMVLGQVTVM
ncbi:Cyclin-A1 [Apodemus speciosus]|uniref:Cyclin-A1 n=1 Tax=Apodemus speciosus TaxID=105296 RepID=A0ABQ0EL81_APOSI